MARKRKTKASGTFDVDFEKVMDSFFEDVLTDLEEAMKDASEWAVKELKKTSPRDPARRGRKGKRRYANGWTATPKNKRKNNWTSITVHNKADPNLTWLLERGHLSKNQHGGPYTVKHSKQGGVYDRVPGIPHIEPSKEKAMELYKKGFERKLRSK